HRRARVEQHHHGPPSQQPLGGPRIPEGEDEEREQGELQEQREQAAQLGEEGRRVLVAEHPIPERREGHGDHAAPQLEDVEHEHAQPYRREDGAEDGDRKPREDHRRKPPRRKTRSISSSKGISMLADTYETWRPAQNDATSA